MLVQKSFIQSTQSVNKKQSKMAVLVQVIVAMILLQWCLVAATTSGEESSGERTHGSAGQDCQDFTIAQLMHLYTEQRLSSPYIHIGVNLSTIEAAQTDRSKFRRLLTTARRNRLQLLNLPQIPRDRVCRGVEKKEQPARFCCPWKYTCDYNPHRFPAYLFHARCIDSNWVGASGTARCREVFHPIPVLVTTGCNPLTSKRDWTWQQEMVSVACSCDKY